MNWQRPHLYLAEPYEHRRLRVLAALEDAPRTETDHTLPSDRADDYEPAPRRVFPLRLARPAAPSSVRGGQVPIAPASPLGRRLAGQGTHNTPDDELPPAA